MFATAKFYNYTCDLLLDLFCLKSTFLHSQSSFPIIVTRRPISINKYADFILEM